VKSNHENNLQLRSLAHEELANKNANQTKKIKCVVKRGDFLLFQLVIVLLLFYPCSDSVSSCF